VKCKIINVREYRRSIKKNWQQKSNVWIDEHLSQYIYITFYILLLFYVQTCLKDSDYPFGIFKLFLKEIIHNAFYFEMVVNVASL
jgi:hypothetical protein